MSSILPAPFSFFAVLLFVVFWCSMFLLYTFMTIVMKLSNAVVVNLSLLTADFYTLLFGIFLFHYHVSVENTLPYRHIHSILACIHAFTL